MEAFSNSGGSRNGAGDLRIRMFGPLGLERAGRPVALPRSRKLRALLAYLALAPRPVSRSHLCDLLWDGPNDPRAELRWHLTKMRGALGADAGRLETQDDAVRLDLSGCTIDLRVLSETLSRGATPSPDALVMLADDCCGTFLDGLEVVASPPFAAWLAAQRAAAGSLKLELLGRLVAEVPHAARDVLRRHAGSGSPEDIAAAELLRTLPAPAQASPTPQAEEPDAHSRRSARASIVVAPFTLPGAAPEGGTAAAIETDLVTGLARLRSLFVIAQPTARALAARGLDPVEAARTLAVDYVVTGTLRTGPTDLRVSVELIEVETSRILWTETLAADTREAPGLAALLGDRLVALVAAEVESAERARALLTKPQSLSAWQAYHRGLWHAYRFTRQDNALAHASFVQSRELDPTFSKAHSGVSFTHFQNAFQGWADRTAEARLALEAAERSILLDERDPAAHWALGRALWLAGQNGVSLEELEAAVRLSPNFAQGHYALAFVQSQAGDPARAIAASQLSQELSPYDPMLFGMYGARAMALARLGRYADAAHWGERAAARPNAHAQILAIAAYTLALSGRIEAAREHLAKARAIVPGYDIDHFLAAMRFSAPDTRLFTHAARLVE